MQCERTDILITIVTDIKVTGWLLFSCQKRRSPDSSWLIEICVQVTVLWHETRYLADVYESGFIKGTAVNCAWPKSVAALTLCHESKPSGYGLWDTKDLFISFALRVLNFFSFLLQKARDIFRVWSEISRSETPRNGESILYDVVSYRPIEQIASYG